MVAAVMSASRVTTAGGTQLFGRAAVPGFSIVCDRTTKSHTRETMRMRKRKMLVISKRSRGSTNPLPKQTKRVFGECHGGLVTAASFELSVCDNVVSLSVCCNTLQQPPPRAACLLLLLL